MVPGSTARVTARHCSSPKSPAQFQVLRPGGEQLRRGLVTLGLRVVERPARSGAGAAQLHLPRQGLVRIEQGRLARIDVGLCLGDVLRACAVVVQRPARLQGGQIGTRVRQRNAVGLVVKFAEHLAGAHFRPFVHLQCLEPSADAERQIDAADVDVA